MALPNFLIVGPPKTGTTSLFDWLSKHPEAHPSKIKETDYFNEKANKKSLFANFNTHGWDAYEKLFEGHTHQKIVFEASPKYVYSPLAAEQLSELENIKILFIHRDPSERLYSEFKFHRFKTKLFSGSFEDYLLHKGIDLSQNIKEENTLWYFICNWLKCFRPEQIIILDFDELKSHPKRTMNKICEFLGIDAHFFESFDFRKVNETYAIRNKKLHYFLFRFYNYVPQSIRKFITSFYFLFNKTKVPPITEEEKLILLKLKRFYQKSEMKFIKKAAELMV